MSAVLWHIRFSNYNEKARWALDFKGVPHERREAPPLLHPLYARRLGGGRTFPLLVLDGDVLGDSTAIVAALERRRPDPPLYPADPAQRARALELEDFFDEDAGHEVRRVALDAARRDPEFAIAHLLPYAGPLQRAVAKRVLAPAGFGVRRYYGAERARLEHARERLGAALDRFQRELQPNGYLAGDGFSVADLTFAALIGSVAGPTGFPYQPADPRFRGLPEVRSLLAERGVLPWVEEMYARHRGAWLQP
jgi:glutathione S-transferase